MAQRRPRRSHRVTREGNASTRSPCGRGGGARHHCRQLVRSSELLGVNLGQRRIWVPPRGLCAALLSGCLAPGGQPVMASLVTAASIAQGWQEALQVLVRSRREAFDLIL